MLFLSFCLGFLTGLVLMAVVLLIETRYHPSIVARMEAMVSEKAAILGEEDERKKLFDAIGARPVDESLDDDDVDD